MAVTSFSPTINVFAISADGTSITLNFTVPGPFNVNKLLFWEKDKFRDETKAVNITTLITGGTQTITITASQVGLTKFDSLYFLEFTVGNGTNNEGTRLGVVANFTTIYSCLLEKTLDLDISGCGKKSNSCTDCSDEVFLLSALIRSLKISMDFRYIEEAVKILLSIEDICCLCNTCPKPEEEIKLSPGLGYQTVNNLLVEV